MAFTRLLKDMNIIAALANKPTGEGGLSPAEFKAKFDEGGLALKAFVNALCGELESGNAAAWIGIQSITGLDATTIQGALIALKTLASQVSSHASTHKTNGSDALSPSDIGAAAANHNHSASDISSGTFSIDRIEDGAISAAKIADGAITNGKVASGAITGIKIANGAITNGKLAANSVTTEKIDANGIALKLANTRYGTSVPASLPTGEIFVVYQP